jgi:hypothetical protein
MQQFTQACVVLDEARLNFLQQHLQSSSAALFHTHLQNERRVGQRHSDLPSLVEEGPVGTWVTPSI